jgi:hypothetical protein
MSIDFRPGFDEHDFQRFVELIASDLTDASGKVAGAWVREHLKTNIDAWLFLYCVSETSALAVRAVAEDRGETCRMAVPVFDDDADPATLTAGRLLTSCLNGDKETMRALCTAACQAGPEAALDATAAAAGVLRAALHQDLEVAFQ